MRNIPDTAWLLTVAQLAERLQIGRNKAYEMVANNEIPSVRLHGVIRVPVHAVEEWLGIPAHLRSPIPSPSVTPAPPPKSTTQKPHDEITKANIRQAIRLLLLWTLDQIDNEA